MKIIPLGHGVYTKVDDSDFEALIKWKWYCKNGYAVRFPRCGKTTKTILMHRLIMKTPQGLETDHINRDRLDNQRINLRICDRTQNKMNRSVSKRNKSGHRGVHFEKKSGKWCAQICSYGKRKTLGRFSELDEAIKVYDEYAKSIFGEHYL